MKFPYFFLRLLFIAAVLPAPCQAHFLWIVAGPQSRDGHAHIFFSESAEPDDPELLNRVADLKVWQSSQDGSVQSLDVTKATDSFVAVPKPGEGPVFGLSHTYGIIKRSGESFLLKYQAKSQPSADPQTWRVIEHAQRLPLEIVPRANGSSTILTVFWLGKPLAGSTITVTGPKIDKKLEATSNEHGEVTFGLKLPGLYSIRAKHSEMATGEWSGQSYSSIRHFATLSLSVGDKTLARATTKTPPTKFPPLQPGLTSFGAAIVGDNLYVYGGHFGKPHHYSSEGQSDQLLKLSLSHPTQWEVVGTGPKRTGLAAVAHGGKFYRIGGFEARNAEADEQSLWSTAEFACFDPKTGHWVQLPEMPDGRSSHDALVIGNMLYVVGGWELQGDAAAKWHETAYSIDLSATNLEWKELPKPPFQRRALSLGESHGKVYAIGGMQPKGGITTETAIFDPVNQTWSEGPRLNGETMEGFGSSAFFCANKLCVTTFAGHLQALSDDGNRWINSGQLEFPRFFHRMLPLNATHALIVGGATMKSGKVCELETIPLVQESDSGLTP